SGFLQKITHVPARPFPTHFVRARSAIESFPPRQVCFTTKPPVHCFDNVTRVSKNVYLTRLAQGFETDGRGCNLGLLVGSLAQILAHRAPVTLVSQQRYRRRALRLLAVSETRSV